jgi:hypothetical protein
MRRSTGADRVSAHVFDPTAFHEDTKRREVHEERLVQEKTSCPSYAFVPSVLAVKPPTPVM